MNKKILVIEDDFDVRENLSLLLSEENYKVFTAENGLNGILKAKEIIPDLIICDVMMPICDGYKVLEELSKDQITAVIPFLFLTAKIELTDMRKGMELGADDYLLKPYKSKELISAVKIRLQKIEKIKDSLKKPEKIIEDEKKQKYSENERIFLTINDTPQFLVINDIVTIRSDNQYSKVFLLNKKNFLIRKSLRKWEELLPEKLFIRIHRNSIINLNYVASIEKWFNNSFRITMQNFDEPLIVSKRYASKLRS